LRDGGNITTRLMQVTGVHGIKRVLFVGSSWVVHQESKENPNRGR
jgi:hypothetical protein